MKETQEEFTIPSWVKTQEDYFKYSKHLFKKMTQFKDMYCYLNEYVREMGKKRIISKEEFQKIDNELNEIYSNLDKEFDQD